eukprot:PhF_6_TR32970/c0_g1_i1/m.48525
MPTTIFYYGADDWPQDKVDHDIRGKLFSHTATLPVGGQYIILLSHNGVAVKHTVTSEGVSSVPVELPTAMGSKETFHWFLGSHVDNVKEVENIFFSSHASGHALECDSSFHTDASLSIDDIGVVMQEHGMFVDTVYFDACCLSTLEVLAALEGVCRNIVAYQTYCPWEGLVNKASVMLHPLSCVEMARAALERYDSREMLPDEQPADIAVLKPIDAGKTLLQVRSLLQATDCMDPTAHPEYPYHEEPEALEYPLYDLCCALESIVQADDGRGSDALRLLNHIQNNMITFYAQSRNNPLKTRGLSIKKP